MASPKHNPKLPILSISYLSRFLSRFPPVSRFPPALVNIVPVPLSASVPLSACLSRFPPAAVPLSACRPPYLSRFPSRVPLSVPCPAFRPVSRFPSRVPLSVPCPAFRPAVPLSVPLSRFPPPVPLSVPCPAFRRAARPGLQVPLDCGQGGRACGLMVLGTTKCLHETWDRRFSSASRSLWSLRRAKWPSGRIGLPMATSLSYPSD